MLTPLQASALRRLLSVLLLCLLVCSAAFLISSPAIAQEEGGDKDLANQEGIGGLFERKIFEEDKMAKPWQMWLGIGSFGVMIIVVKYL
ncbi:MAG: hypothetical protein AMXMBFR84_21940 [Candidatus Hydrogenedentota bacterium]